MLAVTWPPSAPPIVPKLAGSTGMTRDYSTLKDLAAAASTTSTRPGA
jgi:hypothetical protein